MQSLTYDLIIVGAGLTGLNLAKELQGLNPHLNILILEKSKSCGGRMATRRVGESRFDHGAQFIKHSERTQKIIDFWEQQKILKKFSSHLFNASCGQLVMTQLAKKLAENLKISYNQKAISLEKSLTGWKLNLDSGESLFANQVVLTCPLPQSLDILNQSKIAFDPTLQEINYQKAIAQLVQMESDLGEEMIYAEQVDENIFTVTSQHHKGLSTLNEYTLVMTPEWSDKHFEKSDEDILKASMDLLNKTFAKNQVLNLQIKKWRFAQPAQTWKLPFENPAEGLYLAGDAFGGPSLTGAIRSSEALAEELRLRLLLN